MTYVVSKIDKANNYWFQPVRMENQAEQKIDYEAVDMYFAGCESIIDLEEKYLKDDE